MKTVTQEQSTVTVTEKGAKTAAGEETATVWTFQDASQAAKHAAQFADVPGFADRCAAARSAELEAAIAAAEKAK